MHESIHTITCDQCGKMIELTFCDEEYILEEELHKLNWRFFYGVPLLHFCNLCVEKKDNEDI